MSRLVIALALAGAASTAHAGDPAQPPPPPPSRPPSLPGADALAIDAGGATGGAVTPGGGRIAASYLHRLLPHTWLEATAAYAIGSFAPGCFYDRSSTYRCANAFAGQGAEAIASVHRFFPSAALPTVVPFLYAGLGAGYAHFGRDRVDGAQIPVHAGAGLRGGIGKRGVRLSLEGEVGIGAFDHSLGAQPIYGITVQLGVDFGI